MPVAQIRIHYPGIGGFSNIDSPHILLKLKAPADAQFYCDVGITYALPDNPGMPVVFDGTANNFVPLRNINLDPKTLYIDLDKNATQGFTFVIGILSSTNIVTIVCDIAAAATVYITSPTGDTNLQINGEPGIDVQLW